MRNLRDQPLQQQERASNNKERTFRSTYVKLYIAKTAYPKDNHNFQTFTQRQEILPSATRKQPPATRRRYFSSTAKILNRNTSHRTETPDIR